jgi:succinate dehydrogenase flavin-adding protein (antitoxin of CptAB toxin-antitoxin module)
MSYEEKVGMILASLGRTSVEQARQMGELSEIAKNNDDTLLLDMIIEAMKIKKEYDEIMVKMINSLQRREGMR